MLDLPKNFEKRRAEEMKKKVKEARETLDNFLKEKEITIKPIIRATLDGIFPDIIVMPDQFLKNKNDNLQKKL